MIRGPSHPLHHVICFLPLQLTNTKITGIRDYFEENDESLKHDIDKLQIARPSPKVWDVIYGVNHRQNIGALLSCLPERSQVDRLIAKYFEMLAFFRRE